MELVKFCMEKYRFLYTSMKTMCVWKSSVFVWILVWNSMDLSSFGIESIDT